MSEHSVKALDKALQEHEQDVVVDLGADRLLQFISVRLLIILAILAKATEVLNGNLSCHLAYNETGFDAHFSRFANAFCWESPVITANSYMKSKTFEKKLCDIEGQLNREKLLQRPEASMNVLKWLPYWLALEAFMFALPSAWWHFRVGSRLMGHLRFIRLFLEGVCDDLKTLPAGIPPEEPYDKHSSHLNGWCKNKLTKRRALKPGLNQEDEENIGKLFKGAMKTVRAKKESIQSKSKLPESDEFLHIIEKSENSQKRKMLDRHLFSMLCYENFSFLEHYPYLLSIISSTFFAELPDEEGIFPLNQGILRQWCHEDNFSGRFLVVRYYIKHIGGILVSLAMLRLTAFVFELLGEDTWTSDSFRCDVIFHENWFIVCSLHRKTEMLAFLLINLVIILTSLFISIWQLYFVSESSKSEASSFFEYANDLGSVAMLASLREKQEKEDKNK